MKKEKLLLNGNFGSVPLGRDVEKILSQQQQQLLFVVDKETTSLKLINTNGLSLFNLNNGEASVEGSGFFENYVHPEDYSEFSKHINSIEPSSNKKSCFLRIKVKNAYQPFIFKSRLYTGSQQDQLILTTATYFPQEFNLEERTDSRHLELQAALEQSNKKFEVLTNAIDGFFCVVDVLFDTGKKPIDYLFHKTNTSFEEHFTFNAIGRSMKEIKYNLDPFWFNIFGQVALSGQSKKIRKQDFNYSWFDLHAFILGPHKKIGVIFNNVTESINTQEQIKQSRENLEERIAERTFELQQNKDLLQKVFNTSAVAIAVFKPVKDEKGEIKDFIILQVNNTFKKVYGNTDLIGKSYSETATAAITSSILDKLKQVVKSVKTVDYEVAHNHGGLKKWMRIRATPHEDILIFSFEDITEQKVEARNLKESILFKRQIARTSPDIILILDIEKNFLRYANRDLSNLIGDSRKNINTRELNFLSYVHPREREQAMAFHQDILEARDNEIVKLEFRFKTKKQWQWYSARGKVFKRKKDGKVAEYLLLLQDISEQKKTQKALIDAEKLSIKGEVARTLAHELRNPLASIGLASDVLRKKIQHSEVKQTENYLNIISRSAQLLNNLVTDLLNSSNYRSGEMTSINLTDLLETALKLAADRIYLTGIKVIKNYGKKHFILADEERLKIAILNLIINASEAMSPDEGILRLDIAEEKEQLNLTIADNGCGLEQEQLNRLFDAFYTSKPTGVGVGLSSVKNILEEHGADIDVQSTPKKGTSFVITFHQESGF